MKKWIFLFGMILLSTTFLTAPAKALTVLDGGEYVMPDGYTTIASISPISLDHYYYYTWTLNDLNTLTTDDRVEIVFHNIHDWDAEDDQLALYVRDGGAGDVAGSWNDFYDNKQLDDPGWNNDPDWNFLDKWSDPFGWREGAEGLPTQDPDKHTFDLVYTIEGDLLTSLVANNGTFVIGIDPDCHYLGDEITVNAPAPVPEPATMLLFGSGLLGLANIRRKKK